jgi:hypothetical protein
MKHSTESWSPVSGPLASRMFVDPRYHFTTTPKIRAVLEGRIQYTSMETTSFSSMPLVGVMSLECIFCGI